MPGDRKRKARPLVPGLSGSRTTTAKSRSRVILQRPDVSECHGCGVITELIQDSDFCWTCTYDPPCLCTGPRRPYSDV